MEILLIINPVSGDRNKTEFEEFAKRLMEELKLSYHIYKTTGQNDCDKLEHLLEEHLPKKVIVVGGDGTLNMFLKPLMKYDVQVGFIPMGSANGMAVELDLTDSPRFLFKRFLKSNESKKFDLLFINNAYLLLHLGDIGANANLVSNYDKDDSRGMFTYARHFWSEFQNLKGFQFEIQTDKMDYERKGVMLAICNGRKFGTGIPLNTIGKMDDGYFEFVVVRAMDFSDLLKAALSKFDEDYKMESLETIQAKTATVKFKEPRLLQIDGEIIQKITELQVEVLPKVLSFIQ